MNWFELYTAFLAASLTIDLSVAGVVYFRTRKVKKQRSSQLEQLEKAYAQMQASEAAEADFENEGGSVPA